MLPRRQILRQLPIAGLLAACTANVQVGEDAVAGKTPDGFVDMHLVQAAYIGSGSTGTGGIIYRGRRHPVSVSGLGLGGIGISEVDAHGDVFNLPDLGMFPGAYAQARYGYALGQMSSGYLWLQNDSGVIMRLKAKREGLMLSLGGDAIAIRMI